MGPDVIFDYLVSKFIESDQLNESDLSTELLTKIENYKALDIGNAAPNLPLNTNVSLYDVLKTNEMSVLFFWTSQCHFCHQQLEDLKDLYQKHDGAIEFIAYSLDTREDEWQQAIDSKSLNWRNYSDLKGWKSEFATKFRVNKTPSYFILDHEGTIIAKPNSAVETSTIIQDLTR